MGACHNCPWRTVEPNCHNAKTCPDWAKMEAEKAARYRQKADEMMMNGYRVKYDKGTGRYIPGVHPYIDKKKNWKRG